MQRSASAMVRHRNVDIRCQQQLNDCAVTALALK